MNPIFTKHLQAVFSILMVLSFNTAAFGANAVLSWDANTEADLSGYKVYFGTAPGSYGAPIDVGKNTRYTVQDLDMTNGTYYFAVTAYDTSSNESGFSTEVSKSISGSGGGGCGIIRPGKGKPPGPGDAAAMMTILGTLTLLLFKKGSNSSAHPSFPPWPCYCGAQSLTTRHSRSGSPLLVPCHEEKSRHAE